MPARYRVEPGRRIRAAEPLRYTLTWGEVDPAQHPFELDEDAARELTGLASLLLDAADVHGFVHEFWVWLNRAAGHCE